MAYKKKASNKKVLSAAALIAHIREEIKHPKQNNNKTYRFEAGYNSILKSNGWRPQNIKDFDPVPPAMAIHDILEHFPGDESLPHNEYQAQGAMIWLRALGGFFGSADVSAVVVKPAFGMLFTHIVKSKLSTIPCPMFAEASEPLPSSEAEFEIMRVIAAAAKFIKDDRYGEFSTQLGRAVTAEDRKVLNASLKHALGWMRVGYRRAQARFKGLDNKKLSKLFQETSTALEDVDINTSGGRPSKNQVVDVTIDYKHYKAIVSSGTYVSI